MTVTTHVYFYYTSLNCTKGVRILFIVSKSIGVSESIHVSELKVTTHVYSYYALVNCTKVCRILFTVGKSIGMSESKQVSMLTNSKDKQSLATDINQTFRPATICIFGVHSKQPSFSFISIDNVQQSGYNNLV